MSTEKRKSARIPVDFPASFSSDGIKYSGRILNLSVDGVLLNADTLIHSGEIVQLMFELPEHEARMKAKIVWGSSLERGFRMGLFFEDIPAVQQAAIELYIRNLLKI